MLPRQDFGGRHDRGLGAALDGNQHGEQRHDRLAAADVALEQPEHPRVRGHVVGNLAERLLLGPGQAIGQGLDHRLAEPAVTFDGSPALLLLGGAHQRQGKLVGENFVVG